MDINVNCVLHLTVVVCIIVKKQKNMNGQFSIKLQFLYTYISSNTILIVQKQFHTPIYEAHEINQ